MAIPASNNCYSMTGFSTATLDIGSGSLALEIRSVNHRYLDIQLRLPDQIRALEIIFRANIAEKITRGKLECRVSYTEHDTSRSSARINKSMLLQLAQWNAEVRANLPAARELSVAEILHWQGIFENNTLADNKIHELVLSLLQQALLEFNAARAREGETLKTFLLQRITQIYALRLEIAPRIPAAIKAFEEKLRQRLRDLLAEQDDERLLQEISLYASKIDIDEELARLHTHLKEVERVLHMGGTIGKRLDFLMQELHREANTLGAKSPDTEITRASVEMKILIEQMREQIQNLE
jgi:uncharacterized protein (TIGR00255 family)